jgi:hypothetical protein
MIVLDEQLMGRGLEIAVARWYRGTVCFVNELRPNSVIKDEAVPSLLRGQRQPTFVTINEKDFWQRVMINQRFCAICFALDDSQVAALNPVLKGLLRSPQFRTKASRMGSVIRVSRSGVAYYRHDDSAVRLLELTTAQKLLLL